jgi:pimeloyl-ACP methyl ester carboxylesterase
MQKTWIATICCLSLSLAARAESGFTASPYFGEQVLELHLHDTRVVINAPQRMQPDKPTLLICYALPNGNTIEQTIGCAERADVDWHYYIQHIGAQTRFLRDKDRTENIVVAYLEADGKSWPAWRAKYPDNGARIRQLVDDVAKRAGASQIALLGHSGGGSLIFGYLNGGDEIDARVQRIGFLDANYAYSDELRHGEKLLSWLRGDRARHLVVLAYDDRRIELNGKRVVSDTGGTFRATAHMLDRMSKDVQFDQSTHGPLTTHLGLQNQIRFDVHSNPENKILHTRLVEWNGFLHVMCWGTALQGSCGEFCGDPVYAKWVQPAPSSQPTTQPVSTAIPSRPSSAPAGHAFAAQLLGLSNATREQAVLRELSSGNLPDFERRFVKIHAAFTSADGKVHQAEYRVMPDYLAIGSDDDFVRMPMTPATAQALADKFGCVLPTRKMVNDIYQEAAIKIAPEPMTENREATATFVEHNDRITKAIAGGSGKLVAGIKKDVVVSNRLQEKPHRVAIYGWHQLNGQPIQPLTVVHNDAYVDYSHGVRLVMKEMLVDGKPATVPAVLASPDLCGLLSDEGPIARAHY